MGKKLSVMLVLVLVLVTSASAFANWTGTITLWDAPRWRDENDDQFHWVKAKIAEFEALHPGVKIELIETPWAELGEKLSIAIAGRAWPDIVPVDISGAINRTHLEQGVVEALDAYMTEEELEDFFPGALQAYTYKDKLYGIPMSMTVHVMLLNLDHFEEAGVEPPVDGRWTWDEFVEKAKALTFDSDGDGKIDKYGFSTYILQGYYEAWPFFYMDGGVPLVDNTFGFTSPEAISAIQKLVDLKFVHGAAPVEMGSADVGGTFRALAREGERYVAIQPWNTWAIATVTGEGVNHLPNVMVAEYPVGDLGKPVTIGGAGGWVVMHQSNKDKRDVVVEFAKFLSTPEEQYTFATEYGTFPARKSAEAMNPFADKPHMARAAQMVEHSVPLPEHPAWAQIDERIQAELQLIFAGEKSVEDGMESAAAQIQRLLR
ncbi:MAG TPA: sugar ABC transporter substrate-binding protein [Firmicutes bacterium]|jgi:multiple sugar transport system substrate-binding protein|nr:sugar ABC transporter substrate-binding protein [Bacillota bacterium]